MNRSTKTVFLCLAAMFVELTMAQSSPAQPSPAKSSPRMSSLLGPPVWCTTVGDCPVPVTVYRDTTTTGSRDVCQVMLSSETHVGTQLLKKIVWTLIPPTSPGNATYSFQPDYGILVLKDGGRQISRAGLGDGSLGSSSSSMYYAYHLRSRQATDDVTYLPVVLQTVPSSVSGGDPVVTLCGASDPRIVND